MNVFLEAWTEKHLILGPLEASQRHIAICAVFVTSPYISLKHVCVCVCVCVGGE